MTQIETSTQEEYNEKFIYFVAFTIVTKLFPYIENLTDHTILKFILGLAFACIVAQILKLGNKLPHYLRHFCDRLKLKPFVLYLAYILLYILFAYILF